MNDTKTEKPKAAPPVSPNVSAMLVTLAALIRFDEANTRMKTSPNGYDEDYFKAEKDYYLAKEAMLASLSSLKNIWYLQQLLNGINDTKTS